MKRTLGLIIIVAAFVMGFLTVQGTMPFIPIFGSSMEPTLKSGNLLIIEPIDVSEISEGDIIVYNVPRLVRDYYNYPPVVAHRVIEVNKNRFGYGFRTAGDNTGEDPFGVRGQDVRGKVGDQIAYLGLPLLFFQSQQGMIFIIVALALLALFLYSDELFLGGRKLQRGIFSPVIRESYRTNRVFSQKLESNEQRMNSTEQALGKFASAIELYAQHLASHTSAIQGLSEASHELKRSAAEQNRVLMHFAQNLGQKVTDKELALPEAPDEGIISEIGLTPPEPEEIAPEADMHIKTSFPPGCIKGHHEPTEKDAGHRPRCPEDTRFLN